MEYVSPPIHPDPTVVLLNKKPTELTHRQYKHILLVTIAAKQILEKSWKTPNLCVLAVKLKIRQAMIHAKIEAALTGKVTNLKLSGVPG